MAIVIGLTGSIASGKSTVSRMFADLNIPVIDADKISRVVVNPEEPAYTKIVETFGESILHEDKSLNREKLGSIIFADASKREKLNSIVHPAVRERMLAKRDAYVEAGEPAVVMDIPLLFESNLTHFVDKTLVVSVTESVQLKRLMNRNGYSEQEAEQRIKSQLSLEEKAKKADAVIDNNGTKQYTYEQLERLLHNWKALPSIK
ncbi:dephospho-CoA kinase [Oceanobacillus kapialis]|uniref:dephospho-CoA kinase n=1 Tax=Oceanobacillus kapialis TaxID=481353 RepID=UPI00384DC885